MTLLLITYASLSGVFRLIVIISVIYLLYSLLIRFIIPSVVKRQLNKFQQRFYEQNPHVTRHDERKKEGEVTIKYVNRDKTNSRPNNDEDFVDYEEIK